MNVYLIKTPEYEAENFRDVCNFLSSFDGDLKFIPSSYEFSATEFSFLEYSSFKNYEGVKKLLYDITIQKQLTWEQLFSLCDYYRILFKIEPNDFVVLLTERRNELNWFSHFENKNCFVHTGDWEHFTDANPKYPIAYEVVENVMQSLMKIDSVTIPNAYVHTDSRGCMNDFCQNKREIILKLQTANICTDCIEKIRIEGVDPAILNQVRAIFNGIRNEFIFKTEENHSYPLPLVVDDTGKIFLPNQNLEIRLNPLFKTLYIFYLKHTEGVRLNELNDFRAELLSIYRKLSVTDDNQTIELRINDLVNPLGGSFSQKKSKLNKIITDLLGEPLARFYRIEGEPGEPFKINIPTNLIDIRY